MNIVASWLQITMTWKDEKKIRGMSISGSNPMEVET
jgi:hypothetical protein